MQALDTVYAYIYMHVFCFFFIHEVLFMKVSCGRSLMFWTQKITSSVWEGKGEIHLGPDHHTVISREYSGSTNSYQSHNSFRRKLLCDWEAKGRHEINAFETLEKMPFLICHWYTSFESEINPCLLQQVSSTRFLRDWEGRQWGGTCYVFSSEDWPRSHCCVYKVGVW